MRVSRKAALKAKDKQKQYFAQVQAIESSGSEYEGAEEAEESDEGSLGESLVSENNEGSGGDDMEEEEEEGTAGKNGFMPGIVNEFIVTARHMSPETDSITLKNPPKKYTKTAKVKCVDSDSDQDSPAKADELNPPEIAEFVPLPAGKESTCDIH